MTKPSKPKRLDFSDKNVGGPELKRWAEINAKGYNVKAFIDRTELDMEQLVALNRWCAQAIEWHMDKQ